MADLVGNIPITIVQGATKTIRRKFSEQQTDLIESVILSCNELNLQINLQLFDGEFIYIIDDKLSETFKPTKTTYDMTVNYTDGSVAIQTGIPFIVIKRQNPLKESEVE